MKAEEGQSERCKGRPNNMRAIRDTTAEGIKGVYIPFRSCVVLILCHGCRSGREDG